jgi:hypothetical protein
MVNLEKLKAIQEELEEKVYQEQMENLSAELINFVLDKDLKHSFQEEKVRKTTEQSKRVLSYWVKKGIVKPAQRTVEGGWFYFDRIESYWIDIVTQLREFGLDLDKIAIVRTTLFHEEAYRFRMIDFCLMYSILRQPYLMIIYANGKTGFMTAKQYSQVISVTSLAPHLVFNFYTFAKEIFPNNQFSLGLKNPESAELTLAEMKIVYYLRTGDYQEIKIRMKDGETYLIEATRKVDLPKKIIDVIRDAKYQDIEIKVENGRIVNISSTEKVKI